MDPFELLKADHRKVEELFARLEQASGKRKLDVFAEIKSELELHTHIEETILYPALEKPEETHDLTLEAYEEHNVVKKLLDELSRSRAADDEWQAKVKVLQENVEHHVEEEEGELFDKANDALEDEEIEDLGNRLAAEKQRKLGKPVAKASTSKGAKAKENPGVLARLANLVGIGAENKKGAKKSAKRSTKKAGKKSSAGTASKSAARKASSKTSKKSSKKQASSSSKKTGKKTRTGSKKKTSPKK